MRTEKDIIEELDTIEALIRQEFSKKGAIYFFDLLYFAQVQSDLKTELRLARAREG